MKRLIWLVLLVSLGLNLGLGLRVWRERSAVADQERGRGHGRFEGEMRPGGPGGPDRPEGPGGLFSMERFRDLGLTAEQAAQMEALHEGRMEHMVSRRADLHAFREELRDLLDDDVIDRDRVAETRRRHGLLQADLDSIVTEQLLNELDVLTPEQRRQYLDRMPWRKMGAGRR